MVENEATDYGKAGYITRGIIVLCLLFVLNTSADFIVDLGSAKDFLFLDIGSDPSIKALIQEGIFTGDIGWSSGVGTKLKLRGGRLEGDLYRAERSSFNVKSGGVFLGADYAASDLSSFVADVDAAVARFGTLSQDINLGYIEQRGDLTIDRTDTYTVVDIDSLKLCSGTVTLNGQADDIFYIRVGNVFDLHNVDIVVNGTDASRVFFVYDGDSDLTYSGGDVLGNIIAPNASVLLSAIDSFSGSVISGDGFEIVGRHQDVVFEHTVAIPEPAVWLLISLFGGGVIYLRRLFLGKINLSE